MSRFLTLSALAHALVLFVLAFATADWLRRRQEMPLGAFSISLEASPAFVAGQVARPRTQTRWHAPPVPPSATNNQAAIPSGPAAQISAPEAKGAEQLGQPDGVVVGLRERYLYELRHAIEQEKRYPRVARELRQEGRVEVEFQIRADGKFEFVDLTRPSVHEGLNLAAVKLIKGIGEFRPLPPELGAGPLKVRLPIDYVLR